MFNLFKAKEEPFFVDFPEDKRVGVSNSAIPRQWAWLTQLNGLPRLVSEALKEYGTLEGRGNLSNKKIVNWADEIARLDPTPYANWAADWYNKDSIPWCGLFMALVACRSANGDHSRFPPKSYLSALAWAAFGNTVDYKENLKNIWLGDVAVFSRSGGGHVATIIGVTDDEQYLVVLGGNQSDAVNITRVAVSRLYSVRRVPYHIKPAAAKYTEINSKGVPVSTNEA